MSDPAFTCATVSSDFLSLADVPRDPDAVYLFDFDGVIAAGVEDHIYKLKKQAGELDRLVEMERTLGLRIGDMEFRYRRHLVFQELAMRLELPIARGAGFPLAKWSSDYARFFVLTARSGWAATARVRSFLEMNDLKPIELYQVGRVHKDRQVLRTIEEFPDARVFYIEDSLAHLERAETLQKPNLSNVYCDAQVSEGAAIDLYSRIFERGMRYAKEETRMR